MTHGLPGRLAAKLEVSPRTARSSLFGCHRDRFNEQPIIKDAYQKSVRFRIDSAQIEQDSIIADSADNRRVEAT